MPGAVVALFAGSLPCAAMALALTAVLRLDRRRELARHVGELLVGVGDVQQVGPGR
jgi:hypothetical protein